VKDVGGVDVLEAAQGLIEEGLEVGIGKRLTGADLRTQVLGVLDHVAVEINSDMLRRPCEASESKRHTIE
jgi:hypothetical protein